MDELLKQFIAVAKGRIGPEALNITGELTPEQANQIISLVVASTFLSKVNTVRMMRLTRHVNAMDVASRQLKRIAQGSEPAEGDLTKLLGAGAELMALPVQLFADVTLDFIRENASNPQLLTVIQNALATSMGGDILDLAFNGEKDDNSDGFLTLNKGWVQLAKEGREAGENDDDPKRVRGTDIDPATDGWKETLAAVMNAGDERFRRNSVFTMNLADADDYARELGAHVTGTPLTAESPLRRFEGYAIEAEPEMPRGHVFFTPLKNLAFGLHSNIRRDRAYHARKRALEYTFDTACDFEIVVGRAMSVGLPAAAGG